MDISTIQTASTLVQNGSPLVLQAAGRLMGLGQAEQNALLQGAFPAWGWVVAGVTIGWLLGVQAQDRRWAPGWLSK